MEFTRTYFMYMYVFSVEHPIGLMMVVTIGDLISFIARKINLLMKTHWNISGKFKCWGNISAQQGTNCSWWAYLIGFPLSNTSILYFVRLNLKTLNCIQFQIHLVQDIFNWSYFVPIRLINYEWICILLMFGIKYLNSNNIQTLHVMFHTGLYTYTTRLFNIK